MRPSNTYDEIPYTSHPFAQTHPDRLATLGRLFGLTPAPVHHCRVLELGCASGGNLIPMAYQCPDSEFIGVDLSQRQVSDACETVQALALNNVHIKHGSILDIDASWGQFDYILCHGVYSWVPENVQDKILSITQHNLAPHGIAFISYNVYPGWHMREMVRHMMRFHSDQFEEPQERIGQSRALLRFLSDSITNDSYYGALLNSELGLLQRVSDNYLFHEHLEDVNQPIYFYQFIERAKQHGLQYLAEAEFSTMLSSSFGDEVSQTLSRISADLIRSEQYMDFVRHRFFRQTLLCHAAQTLKRELSGEDLSGLLAAASLKPKDQALDFTPYVAQSFVTRNDITVSTEYPLTKAVFTLLGEHWPRAIDIDTLIDDARSRLARAGITEEPFIDSEPALKDLLRCYGEDIVELHTWQANFTRDISATPAISPLTAYYIRTGKPLVNQRHESVELNELTKEIALSFDGKHTQDEILADLIEQTRQGIFNLRQGETVINEDDDIEVVLRDAITETLKILAAFGMLVG